MTTICVSGLRSAHWIHAALLAALCATSSSRLSAQANVERQRRVDWLQANAAPIRSLDPADDDFADLASLGAAIGNARVVMLGEQSHGDGAVFLAKTRMIRYLHEKFGFDVLAFESGIYDVPKAWNLLKAGEDADLAVKRGVFGVWMGSQQLRPLTTYLGQQAKSARPLELTGFDNQFTASASADFFEADLRAFLRAARIDTMSVPDWNVLTPQLFRLTHQQGYTNKPTADDYATFLKAWLALRERVDAIASPDTTVRYWRQVLKSVDAYARQAYQFVPNSMNMAPVKIRDVQMGENLVWLARQKYPTRKIIVWAATFHVMRNAESINTTGAGFSYTGLTTMGHVVSDSLGNQAYAIGFVASEGRAGWWTAPARDLTPPAPESLEGLFASTRHADAFVNLRGVKGDGEWLKGPLVAGPLGYSPLSANWTRVLDGIVYTRTMTPSRPR